jgi:L-arabinokinase
MNLSHYHSDLTPFKKLLFQVQKRYKKATGYLPYLFEGSSPGAGKFGYLKIRRRATPKKADSFGDVNAALA